MERVKIMNTSTQTPFSNQILSRYVTLTLKPNDKRTHITLRYGLKDIKIINLDTRTK